MRHAQFEFDAGAVTFEYCEQIVQRMCTLFGIAKDEAVGRVNEQWRGVVFADHLDADALDIIFHETPDYWAYTIYFGKDSFWWNRPLEELVPLPYPRRP